MEILATPRGLLEAEDMVLPAWTFWESLRWWSKQSKKYKFRQVWVAFYLVLGMVSKIPRSRGVATLNQDSLETKDLIQIHENSILIENYIERILFEYTRLGYGVTCAIQLQILSLAIQDNHNHNWYQADTDMISY